MKSRRMPDPQVVRSPFVQNVVLYRNGHTVPRRKGHAFPAAIIDSAAFLESALPVSRDIGVDRRIERFYAIQILLAISAADISPPESSSASSPALFSTSIRLLHFPSGPRWEMVWQRRAQGSIIFLTDNGGPLIIIDLKRRFAYLQIRW